MINRRRIAFVLAGLAALTLLSIGQGLANARATPLVRAATIGLPGWPEGAPAVRVLLLSDIHIGDPAMDRRRLDAIVAQANGLRPDLVLLAGDFVAGIDPERAEPRGRALTASLRRLSARMGVVAVLGNHDYFTAPAAIAAALRRAGITVLDNDVALRGPLAIGGVGDAFSNHDRTARVLRALRRQPGARLILSHSPDVSPDVGQGAALVLAGHTHCGQIVLPLYGSISVSRYGTRYLCGLVREPGRTTIVTAGVGANDLVPLRFRAPPDMWLLTLGPRR